jgi:hypothetical protein
MVDDQVQQPVNKNSESIINGATEIISELSARVDKFCPHCKALIKESILKL